MTLIEINSNMNSNYENRKHGGYSKIGEIQLHVLESFPQVGIENIFDNSAYFPFAQKIEPGQLELLAQKKSEALLRLKQAIDAYDMVGKTK